MKATASAIDLYQTYLQQRCPTATVPFGIAPIDESPQSSIELNNFAVLALIEAEQSELALRGMYLEMAIEAFTQGAELGHPLCAAHLALIDCMIGNKQAAADSAFSTLINGFQTSGFQTSGFQTNGFQTNGFQAGDPLPLPLGLVYLPPESGFARSDLLQHLLQAPDGDAQARLLLAEVLCRVQLAFYSSDGLRFLHLIAQLIPNSFSVNLRLGLAKLSNQQWEGIFHIQKAQQLAPDYAPILQSLYLIYLNQPEIAEFWRGAAHDVQQFDWLEGQWAQLAIDSPFTYVPFDDLLLAVEPSFKSIVTSVLLAAGDWFEAELEFWRDRLERGMTVIDVGANAGVYTFSAAQRVGQEGRVLAIEPFSNCVLYLQETCRVNQLSQVTVCAGAASDRNGTAQLALHAASELNEIVESDPATAQPYPVAEIRCFSLDSLMEEEKLDRVDWLKIDAERHEMQVLLGSDRLLAQFSPGILYENVAGDSYSNIPVANFLRSRGYSLFRYQPYLQELIPITALEDLQGNLNIIALPSTPESKEMTSF